MFTSVVKKLTVDRVRAIAPGIYTACGMRDCMKLATPAPRAPITPAAASTAKSDTDGAWAEAKKLIKPRK
jgi:hypothetical protein